MMKAEEATTLLAGKGFLDKLYGYAYKRCDTSHEAEELCSDILLTILKAVRQKTEIVNFYAFAWTIAHRVYADFSEKRKQQNDNVEGYSDIVMSIQTNPIDVFIETEDETEKLKQIMREVSFLSKIYRDVMVMYYLDDVKTADIAKKLFISETAVKQRLFSARKSIRACLADEASPIKEAEKMDNNYMLKPIKMIFIGTGNPVGNDPREKAERVLSQNLVFLCKNSARSAKELSELLNVPMPFIEDELEIQCGGLNGTYGLLRKLDNGKYISNILILDVPEYEAANAAYEENLDEFCNSLQYIIANNKDKILSFPFMSKQANIQFITWSLISQTLWRFDGAVRDILHHTYLTEIEILKRNFNSVGFAVRPDETFSMGFYGYDGIYAENLCGYAQVSMSNIYGSRIDKHFGCGHNISTDPQLMMTIRAIGGINIDTLSDEEKEIAAKAIETGYLRRQGSIIEPNILAFEAVNENAFHSLLSGFNSEIHDIAEKTAKKLAALIRNIVPPHLMNEYPMFSMAASIRILHYTIEKCIEKGILYAPKKKLCAEGIIMVVKK